MIMSKPAELHHIGIVVPDLDAAMAEMTRFLGLQWTAPQERPDGNRKLRVAFSTTAPRIELIQGNPGGTWSTSDGPRLDHMAFWISDFEATSSTADQMDLFCEAGGTASWGGRWAYVRTQSTGARVELCDERGREIFQRQWGFTP
jgi:catechol 2,3-dioxygenase-like lactoylglutathione lyase family enzyme